MRVIQRNLVYVTNIPMHLAKEEVLSCPPYPRTHTPVLTRGTDSAQARVLWPVRPHPQNCPQQGTPPRSMCVCV
jgi:hypothetical protein